MLLFGRFPVMVVAHRGFSGVAPENTMIAFKKAIEAGSDMIELDVRLSKDGEVVVIHDESLERTTNGKGRVIDLTLTELKKLDAGSRFHSSFSGEQIPTLKEVLQLAYGQIMVNVELKSGDYGRYTIFDLADRALREVEMAGMVDQVIFSSFHPVALEKVLEKKQDVLVAYLYERHWSLPREVTEGRPFPILNCRKSVLTLENISRAHQEGIRIGVYTLNTEEEMERFIDLKVDAIITNHPDRFINILKKRYRI
ncbi:MAG: glycerophosphodiester phosphodiesterase [Deltaproteobacteria bacterium]|nr:glycerophosphodiester phosphodiesterase [Deltaproteobacteria bacterium]MBM4325034.1 glycerophosphodiester phosphodiesterase [Deltaproteobacteria bacterium]